MEIQMVGVDCIQPFVNGPCQVIDPEFLQELSGSIKTQGLNVPLLVKKIDDTTFQIIDGQKRLVACKQLGHKGIAVIVKEVKDEREQFILALVTNLQRHTLTPLEIAQSIDHLLKLELSQRDIAKLIGKSQAWVQVRHKLLELEPETLKLSGPETPAESRLSQAQAYLLVDIPAEPQVELAKEISTKRLNVTDSRKLISNRVRDEKIPCRNNNSSRLFLIEDVKKVTNFIDRTNEYLNNFLGYNSKKFSEIFEGNTLEQMEQLQSGATAAAESMSVLADVFKKIKESKTSASRDVMTLPKPVEEPNGIGKDPLTNVNIKRANTGQLLTFFGLGRKDLYCKRPKGAKPVGFWVREIDHLGVLEKAKKNYLQKIRKIHPDVAKNTTEAATVLNSAWKILKERFELHGFKLGQ